MMTAVTLWATVIAKAPDGVAEQTQDVRALAADEVADLAPDQDESGRHERFEGDRRLDAADGGVEIVGDSSDRDVHQGGVDDEDEHRHRQQDRKSLVAGLAGRGVGRRLLRHRPALLRSRADMPLQCRAQVGRRAPPTPG